MKSFPRPDVTPARYRELEVKAMQLMLQLDHRDLGECLIVSDICTNILRRWVANERLAEHEIAARKGTPIMVSSAGNIIHLTPSEL